MGFNWNVSRQRSTQIRGGVGVFTGRVPFVWPGGMFLNNGTNTGILSNFGPNEFRPNVQNGLDLTDYGRSKDELIPSGRLEMFEEDFKYPRVLRMSLAVDRELPWGLVGTFEAQYSNTLSNILVTNVNIKRSDERMDGPDNRPIYAHQVNDGRVSPEYIDRRYSNIHRVGNTSRGYTYDLTARLQKRSENILADLSYTYGDAYAVNDGTSSQINSLWKYVENVNGANDPGLARSDFATGHRVRASVTYREEFLGNLATKVSLFFTGESGHPFSYVISHTDQTAINGSDESTALLYVPEEASNLTWTGSPAQQAQQAAEFEEFIEGNDYLSSRRGAYAERNGDRNPFESVIDLKFSQELFGDVMGQQQLELTVDIFNFTNLLNSDWGRRYDLNFNYGPIEFERFQNPEGGDFTPVYSLDMDEQIDNQGELFDREIHDAGTYSSRWQMQIGVRYTF